MTFDGLTSEQAREFALRWLPAWTGNEPERLASFYAEDAHYADPAIPQGVTGRAAIAAYFTRLLANFPDWVWAQTTATPIDRNEVFFDRSKLLAALQKRGA